MHAKKWPIIIVCCLTIFCLSFTKSITNEQMVAGYYDKQLDSLLSNLLSFQLTARKNEGKEALRKSFLNSRTRYKKIEFLEDAFDPYKARSLNGPDLLRIEEENPRDSVKPHGFQTIEAILYADHPDRKRLNEEIAVLLKNITQCRKDPDRIYYFRNDKIWQAMRLGVYRVISLGVTGFDVPLSYHALPEAMAVLASIHKVASFYKKHLNDTTYRNGNKLFSDADAYLAAHNNFNTFDRMVFVRDHINKISAWLTECCQQLGYINSGERYPLNPNAAHLFATNIINIDFFSPNEQYRMTKERIALGKQLFYDTRLSGNGSRSCASCHQAERAFTDGLPKPSNMAGTKMLLRNTPTLWNTALQKRQFYDSRTETLENQLSAVVHNTDEMDGSLSNSIPRLVADKEYAAAFRNAYPNDKDYITQYNIANAISSYVRTLVGFNSRFDRYMRHETDSFTASEKNGFNLFMGKGKCGTCHYAPVFNGLTPPLYQESESEILAVPATDAPISVLDDDKGKAAFTRVPLHLYAFKTPTVRNAALTAPYMHNGVFKTLEDVLSFYNDGGGAGRGITLATQTLPSDKLGLTKKEMNDIVAFLHTLTDTATVHP